MYGNFVWFIGVVEDRNDPEKLNRVRVRCFGYHTESKSELPTEDLPWATPMMPVTASGNSGIFHSPHGLIEGSWVVGFFRDGDMCQDPVIMGSLASKQEAKPSTESGFSDASGTYPKTDYIGVSDVNVHARGDSSEVVSGKVNTITKDIPTALGALWSEPETPYAPIYPKNKVYESEAGHIQEIDDTEGAERLHTYHKSGTFEEIHPDGSVVNRLVKDQYTIIAGNDYVNIKGNVKLTIDTNCETYIKGNWDIKVDGNVTQTIAGTLTEQVTGNVTENYSASKTTQIGGTDTITAPTAAVTYQSGSIEVVSGSITDTTVTLNSHTHAQPADDGDVGQAETNSPTPGT